ncbi:MAG: hypothetical protein H7249_00885 [Chitinophagaceae bacterium]|nr:hypothetical protein [Oligoflexus sp.]
MKTWHYIFALLLTFQVVGCKNASFESIDKSKSNLINSGDGAAKPDVIPADDAVKPTLFASVPIAEILVGSKTTQATAKLGDGTLNPPVTWSVTQAAGKEPGTISSTGVYTSPAKGEEKYTVSITATLKADPTISAAVPLIVVPPAMKPLELTVVLPVPELKVGGKTLTATSILNDGTINPPVRWSVAGPVGKDVGTIDPATGVYKSPVTGNDQFAVIISATLLANETIKGSAPLNIVPLTAADLIVTVPSPEIKIGSHDIQATATLKDGTKNPPVYWSVMTDMGRMPGTIAATGIYTSPASGTEKYPVIITATLQSNPAVKASVSLNLIPDDMIFARCSKANVIFPIISLVYSLPPTTTVLPKDWSKANYVTTVCMDQYDVPEREFTTGFPDVPNLFEWFGMHTTTSILVPKDGEYTIRLISDDGANLWINGTLMIDNDGMHQTTSHDVKVNLKAGLVPINLDYFQGPRYKIALVLQWATPDNPNFLPVPKVNFK